MLVRRNGMICRVLIAALVSTALLAVPPAVARGSHHGAHKGGSHYSHGYVNKHGTYVHGGYRKNPKSKKKH
jgi:hypothetical protein